MTKYTSERAWTILDDGVGKRFIILRFDRDRVHLARWKWEVDRKVIARIAPGLETRLILVVDDIKDLEVVFEW